MHPKTHPAVRASRVRIVVVAMACGLWPTIAAADCVEGVRRAIEHARTSGPFHFVSQQWNENFLRQLSGTMDPGKAMSETLSVQNGHRGPERRYVGDQTWSNDGLGWQGPERTLWDRYGLFPTDAPVLSGTCTAALMPNGVEQFKYEISGPPGRVARILSVDRSSGRLTRYEEAARTNTITTYTFDATIKIEPPTIDMAARRAKSMAAFDEAVASADKSCRHQAQEILRNERGMPFRYEVKGGLWSGATGVRGSFAPPQSKHEIVDGIAYHGGGSETITIGAQTWAKHAGGDWRASATSSPLQNAAGASWIGGLALPGFDEAGIDLIAGSRCPAGFPRVLNADEFIEFEVYVDTAAGRLPSWKRRMYLDMNERPTRIETINATGKTVQVEARNYDATVKIAPPLRPGAAK